MSNSWIAEQFAKNLTAKKRPRYVWNLFWTVVLTIILIAILIFFVQVLSERLVISSEQTFVEYSGGFLKTNIESYDVSQIVNKDIDAARLMQKLESGESITITVSRINGDLIEIAHNGKIFSKEPTPILPTIIFGVILILPMIGLCVFMLIAINIKNPGKRIRRIQDKLVLKYYNNPPV